MSELRKLETTIRELNIMVDALTLYIAKGNGPIERDTAMLLRDKLLGELKLLESLDLKSNKV